MQRALLAMRITSVFAIVVVSTAGLAAAQPRHEESTARVRYGDEGAPDPKPGEAEDGWKQLATPTPAKHGTEFIDVGKDQGIFEKLRIDADRGRVIVRRVKIYFDDGKLQTVEVDRALDVQRGKSALIELKAPAPIDRIVITTEPQGNGTYALYGSSGDGAAAR